MPSEKEHQQQVLTLAKLLRWRPYHTFDSRKSVAGFPDLVLVRPPRIIIAELKSERGKVTPEQQAWLDDFRACSGIEVYVWRPSDWEEIKRVLA